MKSTIALRGQPDRNLLKEMGIIDQQAAPIPHDFNLTELGKQVIVACEGLSTPKEYEVREAAARAELDRAFVNYQPGL